MIKIENVEINGLKLVHTYSDAGYTISQNESGVEYSDAIDPADSVRTYTETENKIEKEPAPDADTDGEAAEVDER